MRLKNKTLIQKSRHSTELKERVYVKEYGFLSFKRVIKHKFGFPTFAKILAKNQLKKQ